MKSRGQYYRIHSDEISFLTQLPRGLFAVIGKLANENKLTGPEHSEYLKQKKWFEEILPVPPFYEDGNSIKAVTWYKNNHHGNGLFSKMTFWLQTAEKYNQKLYITSTDLIPGKIVYEDKFQIGTTDSIHEGRGFYTCEYIFEK